MARTQGGKAYAAERSAEKAATQAAELDKLETEYKAFASGKSLAVKAKHKAAALRIIRENKLCDSSVREVKSRAVAIRNELSR